MLQSFHEKTLLVDESGAKAPKTGLHSMNLKSSLAKQAARGRKGHLTKNEQILFNNRFCSAVNVMLPERGIFKQISYELKVL